MIKRIGWWIFDNIPLRKFAPRFFGWLIDSKPVKITWHYSTTPPNEIKEKSDA